MGHCLYNVSILGSTRIVGLGGNAVSERCSLWTSWVLDRHSDQKTCRGIASAELRIVSGAVVAPSNGTPTRGQCATQALKSDGNGVSLALDVAGVGAGFLPGGGLVTGSARAASFAFGAQVGLTAASTGASIAYRSGPGIVAGILGGQVALTAKSAEALAVNLGRAIPVAGVFVNTGALIYDGYQTYKAYSGCLTGVHE